MRHGLLINDEPSFLDANCQHVLHHINEWQVGELSDFFQLHRRHIVSYYLGIKWTKVIAHDQYRIQLEQEHCQISTYKN